ncbi:hypothetical protein ES703_106872 [subsurface metagenome]
MNDFNAGGVGQRGGGGNQRYFGASIPRCFRHGKAHLARGAVAKVPHRVNWLLGAPGGDYDASAGQVSFSAQHLLDGTEDDL